jgi:thiol-disulfide isomerase/thioredoxin
MTELPETGSSEQRPASRLMWILLVVALVATGVAAYSWNQGAAQDDLPQPVSLEDLASADLGHSDPAPDFSVPTMDGSRFSLSDHLANSGDPVILNLWASWCAPCRAEMPALDAAASRHPGVKFVGVAVQDDLQAAEEFAAGLGVSYTIGLDERDEVNALYPAFGLPVTYVISGNGFILQPLYGELDESKIDAVIAQWFGG